MTKELEAFERIKNHTLSYTGDTYKTLTDSREMQAEDLNIIENALKRNIELEEENKVLKTIKDNFYLWVEPNYRVTLQLLQCCSMTPSEYEKFIEYFGEPRDD